jgi:hypothetical protein
MVRLHGREYADRQERQLRFRVETEGGGELRPMQDWCQDRWGRMCADNGWFCFGARFSFARWDMLDAFVRAFGIR